MCVLPYFDSENLTGLTPVTRSTSSLNQTVALHCSSCCPQLSGDSGDYIGRPPLCTLKPQSRGSRLDKLFLHLFVRRGHAPP